MKREVSRRGFLRGTLLGSLGAIITSRLGRLFPEGQSTLDGRRQATRANTVLQPAVEGEIYAGFLLLPEEIPEGTPLPVFVQCAPAPILCQVDGSPDPALVGEVLWFNSIKDFKAFVPLPMFIPRTLPSGLEFINAYVIRFAQSGDIFTATINFGTNNSDQPLVSIWVQPKYPRPYPVWPTRLPSSHDDIPIYPELDFVHQVE